MPTAGGGVSRARTLQSGAVWGDLLLRSYVFGCEITPRDPRGGGGGGVGQHRPTPKIVDRQLNAAISHAVYAGGFLWQSSAHRKTWANNN